MNKMHKYLSEIRMEHGELLKNMADKLNMKPSELSAIEHGRKPVPEGFLSKIQTLYKKNIVLEK